MQVATASSSVIVGAGAVALEDGLTLVRVRGEFVAFLGSASAAGTGYRGALGIGITDATAFGIGVTAMQVPLDDEEWDGWLYHRFFYLYAGEAMAAAAVSTQTLQSVATGGALRLEVDSKAMRKLKTEDVLFAVIQVVEEGTAAMRFIMRSRVLVKLP